MKAKCIYCGKEFERYDKVRKGQNPSHAYKRRSNCITCSPDCSRKYAYLSIIKQRHKYKTKK